jgi:hypothetical protein
VSGGTVLAKRSNLDLSLKALAVEAGEIWGIRNKRKRFATCDVKKTSSWKIAHFREQTSTLDLYKIWFLDGGLSELDSNYYMKWFDWNNLPSRILRPIGSLKRLIFFIGLLTG